MIKLGLLLLFMISNAFAMEGKPIETSLIFVIHGDESYLFHDYRGCLGKEDQAYHADEVAWKKTNFIAKNCKNCEVLIVRQNGYGQNLPSLQASFFRNGKRIAREKSQMGLWHSKSGPFGFASRIYTRHSQASLNTNTAFIYYGHEIPADNDPRGKKYNHSFKEVGLSNRSFSEKNFIYGLELLSKKKKFDLVLLPITCKAGNQTLLKKMIPFTDRVIASPERINLSGMITSSLLSWPKPDHQNWIKRFLADSFRRLSACTTKMVTVGDYDLSQEEPRINEIHFKAPKFGRYKKLESHPGWPLKEDL